MSILDDLGTFDTCPFPNIELSSSELVSHFDTCVHFRSATSVPEHVDPLQMVGSLLVETKTIQKGVLKFGHPHMQPKDQDTEACQTTKKNGVERA